MSRQSPQAQTEQKTMGHAILPSSGPAPGVFTGELIVVQERPNPTSDYYLKPYLHGIARSVVWLDHAAAPTSSADAVVFVRYVPKAWQAWVEQRRAQLAGLALLIDDDLFDLSAAAAMPWRYRWKLARLATWRQGWLRRFGAELWVSTPYLADKYADWQPRLLTPQPLPAPTEADPTVVFYHGSASHRAEIEWLAPIVREALAQAPTLAFEIIGDARVNRLYRGLPRTSVAHPLGWENYLAFCQRGPRHIGLAPLLPGAFNAARSTVKFYDIERCGAAGIYSNRPPFADFVRPGEDGLLLDNDPALWLDAILRLAADPALRLRIAQAAARRVAALRNEPPGTEENTP
jgi:glycosyltransferase involved in cell wall biosynthesis